MDLVEYYRKLEALKKAKQELQLREAKKDFWAYCKLKAPEFYREERTFLKDLANELQDFLEDDDHDVIVINEPPRHGKSRTGGCFVEWVLGRDNSKKIMTGSYNEVLSTVFSKGVRNTIQEEKGDEDKVVYRDIFPDTQIKYGEGAMNLWSLKGGYNNYLATSPGGTATGFGADILLIDDLIKNAKEANNAAVLNEQWEWFNNTMLSRLETGGKIIIIMTRWHSKDLAGRILDEFPDMGYKVKHINMKALQEDGTMLCEDILTKDEYERKIRSLSPEIAAANYQQEPIDIKGRLYSKFLEYEDIPEFDAILSYTDTADSGSDNLASFVFGVKNKEAYMLDVLYTKEPMEVTERKQAEMLMRNQVQIATFESNNGGKGYARAVETKLKFEYKYNFTSIRWFHQSQNKNSRILTHSSWIGEHVFWPRNWKHRWPELYADLHSYQREGKNEHDDAPDALTGVAELVLGSITNWEFSINDNYEALMAGFR